MQNSSESASHTFAAFGILNKNCSNDSKLQVVTLYKQCHMHTNIHLHSVLQLQPCMKLIMQFPFTT